MHRPALALAVTALAACSPEAAEAPDDTQAPTAREPVEPVRNDLAVNQWVAANYPGMDRVMTRQGRVDLDGDGVDEVLVYVGGPMLCGTGGCDLLVLRQTGEDYEKILQTSVTQMPVGVLDTSSNGMRDLWVTVRGGGAPETIRKLSWDGSAYPTNPTGDEIEVLDTPGTVVIEEGEMTPVN